MSKPNKEIKIKPYKEIKIPKVSKDAKALLQEAKAKPPKRVICQICGTELKNQKGLKQHMGKKHKGKKIRPKWQPEKYSQHVIARMIDDFLLAIANRGMPPQLHLKQDDCLIGEAILYSSDYYGLSPDHPLIILPCSVGLFGWSVMQQRITIQKAKKVKELERK